MTTRTTTDLRQQNRQGVRSLIGMSAATVALLGGMALWQIRPGDDATTVQEAAPARLGAVAAVRPLEQGVVSDQDMYGMWQTRQLATAAAPEPEPAINASGSERGGRADTTMIVYLAGSAAQADDLRRGVTEAAALRVQLGEPPLNETVVVIDSGEVGEHTLLMLGASDAIHVELGLPPMEVVDRRPAPETGE